MTQNQLAELLGVNVDTIRSWRTRRFADKPQFLKPDLPKHKGESCYSAANVAQWLMQNEDYKARVVALLAPEPAFVQQPTNQHPASTLGLAVICEGLPSC